MSLRTDGDDLYSEFCSRIDRFIFEKLDHGIYKVSATSTENIFQVLATAFAGEPDVIETFMERLRALGLGDIKVARSGEELLLNVQLKYPDAAAFSAQRRRSAASYARPGVLSLP